MGKYTLFLQTMEAEKRILRMENALKAKELNEDQLALVMSVMQGSLESGGGGGGDRKRRRR